MYDNNTLSYVRVAVGRDAKPQLTVVVTVICLLWRKTHVFPHAADEERRDHRYP